MRVLATLVLLPLLLALPSLAPAAAQDPLLDPAAHGRWDPPQAWPVQGEYAAVLPTGKVLAFVAGPDAVLWDPATGTFEPRPLPSQSANCAGLAMLADGRVLVNGGHNPAWHGTPETWLFDPWTETWTRAQDMRVGRYYPGAVTLADGRVLTASGNAPDGADATVPEVWSEADGWTLLESAELPMEFYPRLHVLPDGSVARVGQDAAVAVLDTGSWTWSVGPESEFGRRWGGASALLSPTRALVVGGGALGFSSEGGHHGTPFRDAPGQVAQNLLVGATRGGEPATARAEIVDFSTTPPTWSETGRMHFARRDLNAVNLPDGTVLAVGGAYGFEPIPGWGETALSPELYDPATGAWSLMAPADRHRGYHSTAVLLPDGRVLSAGGDFETGVGSVPGSSRTGQVFSPPYLFRGERPVVEDATRVVAQGGAIELRVAQEGEPAARVVLARLGAATHSINNDQRVVPLDLAGPADAPVATLPDAHAVTPPGWYMLFALSDEGVPSLARMVQVVGTSAG